ncbi:MAG: RNA methyltransferase [Alphaproteobacteria bacterium RIFCSPHIGHO2_12_FULL_45_9]|nr:MAG: RNA methyltransferase [Alphaproteobacteria bacterium RIFCSPHIGHO2_02_FULL_46_13]OFW97111.1 MAG: RNA methyltransferase [Alphaproteobacteria bacterium RIFCSPHIGHO2_12_FULL_45_9]
MSFEIFLATAPGLEGLLYDEVRSKGFKQAKNITGGVTIIGGWPEVWRANLWVRGASRVLARIDSFKVLHLAELNQRTREIPWGDLLGSGTSFRVEVTCSKSRIYHSDAAAERIERAIAETLKSQASQDAEITVMARIHHDICTISIDTSGESLHKRGFKESVNKAPMRENMAALFLQQCGYKGTESVFDPMCGSGTFVIEAAEIAMRLNPGRARHFAFEKLANFDLAAWEKMRSVERQISPDLRFYGSDRDEGAVRMSGENAARAGVEKFTEFQQRSISDIVPPTSVPGLVIINPPYGTRIGDKSKLLPLYQTLGKVLHDRFSGWRVGLIATDTALAKATSLPFLPTTEPVQHGGLRVNLFRTESLA